MSGSFTSENFTVFLKEIDPTVSYSIIPLTGDLINNTVRATKLQGAATGTFPGHSSIVLKHAPPFVASVGEDAPFSVFRQVVEARALEILANAQVIQEVQRNQNVSIPSVLYRDDARHVLAITDLGDDLSTIDRWFNDINNQINQTDAAKEQAASIGRRLGIFLATVHNLSVPESSLQSLDNLETREVIRRDVVDRVSGVMETFQIQPGEALLLKTMMEAELDDENQERWVMSVGDLWVGSVLISPNGERVAVVDWEFAGRGRPLQDMAQFGSFFNNATPNPVQDTFIGELFRAYHRESLRQQAAWTAISGELAYESLIKSTWILHGREIVYRAVNLPQTDKDREALAEIGFRYLRAAQRGITGSHVELEGFLKPLYLGEGK
ncbi:hypothetical protein VNI00_013237 [Paramarasmius palmivorus]|uniref:Aminoglycoside phosphotransferase domain-containing protein n=1 Tax=Paramarasmius palmivorus TaxID=297713 RepID=A0AAW0BZI7_9AGAR